MPAPQIVSALVERFERNYEAYKAGSYNETQVRHVEQMLSLQKQLPAAKTGHDQTMLQRRIDAADCQIDRLVYGLYGLTDDEIAVVEGKQS